MISLASAVPPYLDAIISAQTSGCTIDYPSISLVPSGDTVYFHFHVYNKSDGLPMVGMLCDFLLYNNTGNHIYTNYSRATTAGTLDYEIMIPGTNFTNEGYYYYTFSCNNSLNGCYVSVPLEVTKHAGAISAEARSNVVTLGITLIFGIAVLFFMGFLFYKRNNDEEGLESGEWKVPWRWTFFYLSIMFITFAINIASLSIANYLGESNIARIFDMLGALCYYFYWFIGVLLFITWVLSLLASAASKKNMQRAQQIGQPWDLSK